MQKKKTGIAEAVEVEGAKQSLKTAMEHETLRNAKQERS
jgi:hypothetical protein